MGTRSKLKARTAGTGRWVFRHEQYVSWRENGDVLWISGRPGSGKSMLVDFIAAEEQARCPNTTTTVIPFFFYQGDGELHRSSAALYRTILHKVLSRNGEALSKFVTQSAFSERYQTRGPTKTTSDWQERELREQCMACLQMLVNEGQQVLIFIDAIDELARGDMKRLVRDFRDLSVSSQHRSIFASLPDRTYWKTYTSTTKSVCTTRTGTTSHFSSTKD